MAISLHSAGLCRKRGLYAAALLRHEHCAKAHKGDDKNPEQKPGAYLARRPREWIPRLDGNGRVLRIHRHRLEAPNGEKDVPLDGKPQCIDPARHDVHTVNRREDLAQRIAAGDGRIDRNRAVVRDNDGVPPLHETLDGKRA